MPKKASLRNVDKSTLPLNCSTVLPISVNYSYHENEDFQATIELAKALSASVTIIIADTLQRFTEALVGEGTENDHLMKMKIAGQNWRSRNKSTISQLEDKLQDIFFWEDYLNNKDYEDKRLFVNKTYKENEQFRIAVDNTADSFLKRRLRSQQDVKKNKKMEYCKEYILEECAVLLLWEKENYNLILYPHELNLPMKYLLENFIYINNKNLLKVGNVKFKNIKVENGLFKVNKDEVEGKQLIDLVKNYFSNSEIPWPIRKRFVFSLSTSLTDAKKYLQEEKNLNTKNEEKKVSTISK